MAEGRRHPCKPIIALKLQKAITKGRKGQRMGIEKNGTTYEVKETAAKWTLKALGGKVSLAYEVSKKDCKTLEELKQYVTGNDLL